MKVGIIVPQGWTGEYAGWQPADAWRRSLELAVQAEALGFDSLWAFDHFHTTPDPTDELTFESFTLLSAVAAVTERVQLGHLVMCAGFRNPALAAKMISTLDVVSGGRAILGIGAGWKREEWEAYGYRFPSTRERLAVLEEQLEVITRMFEPGRSSYAGQHLRVEGAINEPRGLQAPRIPIMVGGNGPERTWRLAARFADELNLDAMSPQAVAEALPTIADRCDEIGRSAASLAVSVHVWWEHLPENRNGRRELLAAYRETGIQRLQTLLRSSVDRPESLAELAEDCREAGAELASVITDHAP